MGYWITGVICFAAGIAFMYYLPKIVAWTKGEISAETTKVETEIKSKL